MATLIPDNIDFSAYLAETDAEHKVRPTDAFVEELIQHLHAPEELKGSYLPWPKTRDMIRLRSGEVTLWNGMNGHGKSLVLGMVALALVQQGQSVCIASMEMKPRLSLKRMCRQSSGMPDFDSNFVHQFNKQTKRRLWFYDQQGSVKAAKMLAVVRYCADRLKIQHIVIDSLLKCGMADDDYSGQKSFVDSLTTIARDQNIHIHLVVHSRKQESEKGLPGKMDVRGAGAITDLVDNVLTVWRNKAKEIALSEGGNYDQTAPDTLLICDKQRNGEWEGRVPLWFHASSWQFVENGISGPMVLLAS